MKHYIITIAFLVYSLTSCTDCKSITETIDNNVLINSSLKKTESEILDINWTGGTLDVEWSDGKIHPNTKYPFSFFNDKKGICRLAEDTIFISTHQRSGASNRLDITISKGFFLLNLKENNCTYSHDYKILKQNLTINKSNFQIGDTLIGQLFCQAIYIWDTVKNVVDTTTISGKFKFKIRNRNFDFDSLNIENNYQELLKKLSNKQPDTVKELRLSNCGLHYLPKELSKFREIETLEIENNNFAQTDLKLLCEFKKLRNLGLNNCNISKIPTSVFCLKNLERLDLFNNEIESLPTSLFGLKNLKELQLGGNLLTSIPNEILNLKKLKMLEISGFSKRNNIKKLPTDFFKTLNKLTEFYPPEYMDKGEYNDYKPKND